MLYVNCATAGVSSRWPGPSYWSPAVGRQGGVVILLNPNFQGDILSWCRDSDGQIVSLLVCIDTFKINLINIYAPTNLTDPVVLGGDFNCYERDLDKFGGNVFVSFQRVVFQIMTTFI